MKTLLRLAPLLLALALPASAGESSGGAVVIELFTSQGCSSCPPADRLLSELGRDPAYRGRVFPLAFHVDYWNYIGWQDPFSSARWSERQRDYARSMRSNRVYTPQLVVNGTEHAVGSDRREVRRLIDRALGSTGEASVGFAVGPALLGDAVELHVEAESRADDELVVLVALYETGLETDVSRGENARKTLDNDYVVRELVDVLTLVPGVTENGSETVRIGVEPEWDRGRLGAVAFLQADDGRIVAAAGAPVR